MNRRHFSIAILRVAHRTGAAVIEKQNHELIHPKADKRQIVCTGRVST